MAYLEVINSSQRDHREIAQTKTEHQSEEITGQVRKEKRRGKNKIHLKKRKKNTEKQRSRSTK